MEKEDENYSLKIEAAEVIKEIRYAVKNAELSSYLRNTDELVYFNLQTKEDCKYCVELTPRGFRMVGKQFDNTDMAEEQSKYFETIYALLDSISPGYRNTFGDTLTRKLQGLQQRTAGHNVNDT